ncbi:MAG: tRNA pseudouridine(55) synthase TruB [Lachnospiraceae bacterium]|nr:tRNA pseudouridine(55) synthase TruB [Lachnospiraceae bacterium]
MLNGIINVYKEKGYTSHDVVAKLRGILKQKKIGHTGTLDPEAEGVLPVCLGKGTKLCDVIENTDKTYQVVMLLGIETDTEDMTGSVVSQKEVNCTPEEVEEVIRSFQGNIMQIPPMYSALKVNGKKLYELARSGKEVERRPRPVTIYDIKIITINLPEVVMEVRCSKGTYIRSLCRDIGKKLTCGGCMKSLIRTEACGFHYASSYRLNEIERIKKYDDVRSIITSIDRMFVQYPAVIIPAKMNKLLYNGNTIEIDTEIQEEKVRVYDEKGHFIGVYLNKDHQIKPIKLFFDMESLN